jgi:hypothetical protein
MPYALWLTKHRRFEDVKARAPDKLTLGDLRACLRLLEKARPVEWVQRPDGAHWVFRKGEAEPARTPLLSAGVRPNSSPQVGTIELSVSLTSPFFLSNMHDALAFAALVNEELGLFAYESARGQQVTVEALEALLDPQGEYALAQGRIFFQRREELYLNVRMPFEVPAGQQDDATNMLAFRLKHPKLPRLEKLLEPPQGQRVEVEGDRGVWVSKASDEPVTWFMRNPHAADELLIWPHWAEDHFLQTARETYAVAERLRDRSGAQLLWNGELCTPKQMEWLRRYPNLLAVELMQWLESKWEPAARGR